MIVCICNNLNTRQVHEAIAAGAEKATAIYAHHGVAPQCGRCLKEMRRMLAEREQAERESAAAADTAPAGMAVAAAAT